MQFAGSWVRLPVRRQGSEKGFKRQNVIPGRSRVTAPHHIRYMLARVRRYTVLDSNVGWLNVGPTSVLSSRRWPSVSPTYIALWVYTEYTLILEAGPTGWRNGGRRQPAGTLFGTCWGIWVGPNCDMTHRFHEGGQTSIKCASTVSSTLWYPLTVCSRSTVLAFSSSRHRRWEQEHCVFMWRVGQDLETHWRALWILQCYGNDRLRMNQWCPGVERHF